MKKLILLSILFIIGCEETLEPEDCAGFSGGHRIEDDCGVCHGPGVSPEDSIWNETCLDCLGEINGTANIDDCGICDNDLTNNNTPSTGTCDCSGTPSGTATNDNCGVCDIYSYNDCQQDCEGAWGGNAIQDICGVCDTDATNDCVQDCFGEWGGNALEDECGVCDGPGDIYECACYDIIEGFCDCEGNTFGCDGICNSGFNYDLCGICGGYNECAGCMDPNAYNYDPDALVDDGSCPFYSDQIDICLTGLFPGSDEDQMEFKIRNNSSAVLYVETLYFTDSEGLVLAYLFINEYLYPGSFIEQQITVPQPPSGNWADYLLQGYNAVWQYVYNGNRYMSWYEIAGWVNDC